MPITRPATTEYNEYFEKYIRLVSGDDLIKALYEGRNLLNDFVLNIPEQRLDYRYAEGKWNIREILVHLSDCERVFAFRALWFARKDPSPLPGFDEELWGQAAHATNRNLNSILGEYHSVRQTSIELFESFRDDEYLYRGIANNNETSVRALGYIICGHELHHLNVIKERYLKPWPVAGNRE